MTWGSRPSLENSNLINSQGKITQNTCRPNTQVHLLHRLGNVFLDCYNLKAICINVVPCFLVTSAEINMFVEDDGLLPLVKLMMKCKSVPAYLIP